MRNKVVLTLLTFSTVSVLGIFGYASATTEPTAAHIEETQSSCLPSPCHPPVVPAPTSTSSVSQPQVSAPRPPTSQKAVAAKPRGTAASSTTSTSEVPAPLTTDQEASIPPAWMTPAQIAWCDATHQRFDKCKFPESKGMADPSEATDWMQ
jgi:hypothetical protein